MSIVSKLEFGVLRLTIRRPERRNTITSDMFASLSEALRSAEADPGVRVVLIEGEGAVFSAGADLEESLKTPDRIDREMSDFFTVLRRFPKPVVALVAGPAVGEAFAMLLYCDLVYAGTKTLFSIPSVALARTPRFGVAHVMTSAAGYPKAAEKLLLSEPLTADEAAAMRLVTAVIDDDELAQTVAAKAARLAVLPPEAVAETKRLMRLVRDRQIEALADEEEETYARRVRSAEAAEALKAFTEGRKPVFRPEGSDGSGEA